jgi:hypothetical protein
MFFATVGVLFFWLRSDSPRATTPSSPVTSETTPGGMFAVLVPWGLIAFVVLLALFRSLGDHRRVWNETPYLWQPQSAEINEQGVRVSNALIDTFCRWSVFVGWAETRNLLLILLPNKQRLAFPKRAFATEAEVEQVRAFVQSYVRAPVRGFPVLPANPSPSLEGKSS